MRAYQFCGEGGKDQKEIPIPEEYKEKSLKLRKKLEEALAEGDDSLLEKLLEDKTITS